MTARLLNARQQVSVRILEDDNYTRMSDVTIGVARLRTPIAQSIQVRSICQNMQSFTCNGDVCIYVKILERDEKPQTNKQIKNNLQKYLHLIKIFGEFFFIIHKFILRICIYFYGISQECYD